MFLRTTEFLWQEGHTAHATSEEAEQETQLILGLYKEFMEQWIAMPVLTGLKTESEKFAGAVRSYSCEALMQDNRALQAGTSHFLGQNFSKACGIKFQDEQGKEELGWTTSWGVSTRLIGGMIMCHGDDDGLVVPPRVAPSQVVVLPVTPKEESREQVLEYCRKLVEEIGSLSYAGSPVRVELDDRDLRGGEKYWQWIKKGVPVTLEVGPRDLESDSAFVGRRDVGRSGRQGMTREDLLGRLPDMLQDIQDKLLERALAFREENTREIDSKEEFYEFFSATDAGAQGGFAMVHWDGDAKWEEQVKNDLKVTLRCIPQGEGESGTCIFSGNPSPRRVVFALAY